jgi:hypothetical protein
MTTAVYDSDNDGRIDADAGGTDADTSDATGFARVVGGLWTAGAIYEALDLSIDSRPYDITAGYAGQFELPWPARILRCHLFTPTAATATVDFRVSTYDTYPPTAGNSICDGNEPALQSATHYEDADPWGGGGGTINLNEGDVVSVHVADSEGMTFLSVHLKLRRLVG